MMLFDDNEEITINILNNEISLDQKCWCCDGGEKNPINLFKMLMVYVNNVMEHILYQQVWVYQY